MVTDLGTITEWLTGYVLNSKNELGLWEAEQTIWKYTSAKNHDVLVEYTASSMMFLRLYFFSLYTSTVDLRNVFVFFRERETS